VVLTRLAVRLTPRGGRDAVEGWGEDAEGRPLFKARVAAPPVQGEANAALVKLIAKTLGLPRSAVRIASGETARIKVLEINGLDEAAVRRKLGA
jgi:uncharacterized protein YggU (UPF0235/DUF167 family)